MFLPSRRSLFRPQVPWLLAGLCCVALALTLLTAPLGAHHSYVTKYDPAKFATIKGVIAGVEYRNPHIFFDLAVTNRDGSTTTWRVETESIAKAQAKGLKESVLSIGSAATVTGWIARDKTAAIGLKSVRIGSKSYVIRSTPR